jgi:hypothetical protein
MQPIQTDPIHLICSYRTQSPVVYFPEKICKLFQISRRYSIVVTQISLFVLNIFFLIAKLNSGIPDLFSRVTLTLLSTIGILSLHYTIDLLYKSVQDFWFALECKSKKVACFSVARIANQANTIALVGLNFIASVFGLLGNKRMQSGMYHHMIVWGEVSLLAGLFLVIGNIFVVKRTLINLPQEQPWDPSLAPWIHLCMDKDTLWTLKEALKDSSYNSLSQSKQIILSNLNTQLKITHGSRLALILIGDLLQAIEKIATPNSLTAAVINTTASFAWSFQIGYEKWQEIAQRRRLQACQESPA